jgi:hypothetical protein
VVAVPAPQDVNDDLESLTASGCLGQRSVAELLIQLGIRRLGDWHKTGTVAQRS